MAANFDGRASKSGDVRVESMLPLCLGENKAGKGDAAEEEIEDVDVEACFECVQGPSAIL